MTHTQSDMTISKPQIVMSYCRTCISNAEAVAVKPTEHDGTMQPHLSLATNHFQVICSGVYRFLWHCVPPKPIKMMI